MHCCVDSYSILRIAQYFEDVTTDHDQSSDQDCIYFDHCVIFSYLGAKRQLFSYSKFIRVLD